VDWAWNYVSSFFCICKGIVFLIYIAYKEINVPKWSDYNQTNAFDFLWKQILIWVSTVLDLDPEKHCQGDAFVFIICAFADL
jgi:hypothetical protein